MVFLQLSLLPYIPHIFFLNHNDLYRPILPEFVEVMLAPGDRDHILSGVFNQFLSALTEPVE